MKEKVKLALRISHTLLDSDIDDTIASAKLEMSRAGVSDSALDTPDELVEMCIKTYCLMHYANNEKMAEGYQKSFELQLDQLRKSTSYV